MEALCLTLLLAQPRACDPPVPTPAALLAAPFSSVFRRRGWFLLEQHMRLCFLRVRFFADFCAHSCERVSHAFSALPCFCPVLCVTGDLRCSSFSDRSSSYELAHRKDVRFLDHGLHTSVPALSYMADLHSSCPLPLPCLRIVQEEGFIFFLCPFSSIPFPFPLLA